MRNYRVFLYPVGRIAITVTADSPEAALGQATETLATKELDFGELTDAECLTDFCICEPLNPDGTSYPPGIVHFEGSPLVRTPLEKIAELQRQIQNLTHENNRLSALLPLVLPPVSLTREPVHEC